MRDTLLSHVVPDVISVHLPKERVPDSPLKANAASLQGKCELNKLRLKGVAFLALPSESDAKRVCQLLDNFPWLVRF